MVLVDGELVVYVERGGRTLLTFADRRRRRCCRPLGALASPCVRRGALGRLTVERADGENILARRPGTRAAPALEAAGFVATPRGLRLRG